MNEKQPNQPYLSASDLPTFVKRQEQLRGLKLLSRFVAGDQQDRLSELEAELHRMSDIVDRFCELLGPRNWVFHDQLHLERMAELTADGATVDSAEEGLVAYYSEPTTLKVMMRSLAWQPQLQMRMHLIERAIADYFAGRFYATTLVLLTVMDGFVNDFDGQRKGLHARSANEMVGWDSVVGHHLGLSHAHVAFTKKFGKTRSEEFFELHRHGIIHGTILHYDNIIVATKAWNRLFAVENWARSVTQRDEPPPPQPSLRETIRMLIEERRTQRALALWHPSIISADDPAFEQQPILRRVRLFLESWQVGNCGRMASCLPSISRGPTVNAAAGKVRAQYEGYNLTSYEIIQLSYEKPYICDVTVQMTFGDVSRAGRMRWNREKENGLPAFTDETGEWVLVLWSPPSFFAHEQAGF